MNYSEFRGRYTHFECWNYIATPSDTRLLHANSKYHIPRAQCVCVIHIILILNSDYFPNIINRLVFVLVEQCILWQVRSDVFNIILDEFQVPNI
jgi:hypothetical protein